MLQDINLLKELIPLLRIEMNTKVFNQHSVTRGLATDYNCRMFIMDNEVYAEIPYNWSIRNDKFHENVSKVAKEVIIKLFKRKKLKVKVDYAGQGKGFYSTKYYKIYAQD